jgi:hypothetical protein
MNTRAALLAALSLSLLACGEPETTGDAAAPVLVNVTYGGDTQALDLGQARTTNVDGQALVQLASLALEAYPQLALGSIVVNFVAADGFVPANSPNCESLVPVLGMLIELGYIVPETRNLIWDETLQYPGCMSVTDTAEIQLADQ